MASAGRRLLRDRPDAARDEGGAGLGRGAGELDGHARVTEFQHEEVPPGAELAHCDLLFGRLEAGGAARLRHKAAGV